MVCALTDLDTVDRVEDPQRCLAAELLQVSVNARELRARVRRQHFPVVKADHGELIRHALAEVACCVEHSTRDLVRSTHDRNAPGSPWLTLVRNAVLGDGATIEADNDEITAILGQ